jgi:hypothetical protein
MGGKALLIVVVGFSFIYVLLGKNFNDVTTRAVINAADYFNVSVAHNIAVSGANMAANKLFVDPTWVAGFSDISYQKGKLNVRVLTEGNQKTLTSIAAFHDVYDTVIVILQPSKFSKFAYYSVVEPTDIWWMNGDSVWGPFHTQDYLRISGSPVFNDKTTTLKGIKYNSGYNNPKFLGEYAKGVSLPLPDNSVTDIEAVAGKVFSGHDTVYVTFVKDSIKYKYSYSAAYTTVLGSNLTSNGVIYAKNAIVRLQGESITGKYTVVASGTTKGTVYLDDNVNYTHDPIENPASEDMLGIVAENYVYVTENVPNSSSIDIDATIFCKKGGFGAEKYWDRGIDGNINLLGGIIQYQRQAVGQSSGGSISTGFSKRYKYDNRLRTKSPPCFPTTNSFEIVSWYE